MNSPTQGYEINDFTPYMEYQINGAEVPCNLGNISRRKRRAQSNSRRNRYCGQVHEYLIYPNRVAGPQISLEQRGRARPWSVSIGTCIEPTANGGEG